MKKNHQEDEGVEHCLVCVASNWMRACVLKTSNKRECDKAWTWQASTKPWGSQRLLTIWITCAWPSHQGVQICLCAVTSNIFFIIISTCVSADSTQSPIASWPT